MRVDVHHLTVRYGRTTALAGVSLEVAPGAVFALVGRNGSGKSSLVKVLLGQRRADAGEARIDGLDPWRQRVELMARIGATPEVPDANPATTPLALARLAAALYPTWEPASFRRRLERFEVPADRRFGDLSRGQRALVMLALALAHRPALLVLDDPTLGLDAVARRYVFDELIGELAERGVTVFVTSHDLDGIERVATHVGILQAGRIVDTGTLDALRQRAVEAGVEPPTLEEIVVAATTPRKEDR